MRGLAPSPEEDPGYAMTFGGRPYWKAFVDHQRLPLAPIVQLVFRFLGCRNLGYGEKLAWEYPFTIDGAPCSIASQKFGIRLYMNRDSFVDESAAKVGSQRIVAAIIAGQSVIEREVLRPLGEEQMRLGNVTVHNQYHRLRRAYEYFREGARIAYAGEGRLVKSKPDGGGSWIAPELHEAWWNTFAMVVAYFSLLEHVLVGCLPFTTFDPSKESVKAFIGLGWREKFKRIFSLDEDRKASEMFSVFRSISEEYRNTYGHGGFDKAGATVAFQVPTIGPIPAILSDVRDSPHFDFVPTRERDFDALCSSFDNFEGWLASGELGNAWTWITAGLDY
jgi:hypothetical protein